ncbi:MAG: VOC family protein [Sulfuricella denitrificans]|nr:VOC family protein [Sulfuricella denitrificans]
MRITEFLHVSLLVADLDASRCFYEGVLELAPSPKRPDMAFDGVWYEIGAQQIHLIALPNPDPVTGRPEHGGRDRHIALGVLDMEQVKSALDRSDIPYTLSRSGRPALFCRDPDGNALELVGVM